MHAPSVHVFAASGPVDAGRVDRGIEVMRRLGVGQVGAADNLYTREGYFAGDDASRLQGVIAGWTEFSREASSTPASPASDPLIR